MNARDKPIDSMTERQGNMQRLALRPKEAAAALGIGIRLLWELTNRGVIPHVRMNSRIVYPVDQLRKYLAEQSKGGCRKGHAGGM